MVMSFTDHKNNFNNSQREMMPSYFIFYDIVSKKYEMFWPNLYDGVSK